MSMDSHSSVSSTATSGTGSRSTVYVPPIADIPEMSTLDDDLYASESDRGRPKSSSSGTGKYESLLSSPSVSSSGSGTRRIPSTLISSYHSRTVDDTVISGDEYVYRGDSRAVPRRGRQSLRRSGSMTDLGADGLQSNRSSALNEESDDQFFTAGTSSSAQRSSVYSSAESYSSRTNTGTRTLTGLTSTGLTGTTGTYTRTGTGTGTGTATGTGTGTGSWTATGTGTATGTWSGTGTETGTRVSESTRYTRTIGTGPGSYTSYSGSGSYTGTGSGSYTASGTGLDSRTGVTGTGTVLTTDYESRTGYGSGSYTGSPYTG